VVHQKTTGSLVDRQAKTEELKMDVQQHRTGLTVGYQFDR
jgi:hypothetical protein